MYNGELGERVLEVRIVLSLHRSEIEERRRSMGSRPEGQGHTERDGVGHRRGEQLGQPAGIIPDPAVGGDGRTEDPIGEEYLDPVCHRRTEPCHLAVQVGLLSTPLESRGSELPSGQGDRTRSEGCAEGEKSKADKSKADEHTINETKRSHESALRAIGQERRARTYVRQIEVGAHSGLAAIILDWVARSIGLRCCNSEDCVLTHPRGSRPWRRKSCWGRA